MDILTNKKKRLLKSNVLNQISYIEHAFSTRDFGNLGLHVGDIKYNVIENRKLFAEAVNINFNNIVSAKQVHGNNVVRVYMEDVGKGATDYENSIENCDALVTDIPKIPLFAFYADCVPIFLVDPIKKAIGIVHSGWKGTLYNIAGNTVDVFVKEFKSNPGDLIAVIGPYICKDCYEVSSDIIEKFKENGFIEKQEKNSNNIDLGNIIKNQLLNKGLKTIEQSTICTSCNLDLFFSHRKEQGETGRMAGIIMIKGD
jgi:polyphenol oxidase